MSTHREGTRGSEPGAIFYLNWYVIKISNNNWIEFYFSSIDSICKTGLKMNPLIIFFVIISWVLCVHKDYIKLYQQLCSKQFGKISPISSIQDSRQKLWPFNWIPLQLWIVSSVCQSSHLLQSITSSEEFECIHIREWQTSLRLRLIKGSDDD